MRALRPWAQQALFFIAFFLGVGLLIYPLASNYLFTRNVVAGLADYGDHVSGLSPSEIERMRADALAYNDALRGDPVEDPFVFGSGIALPQNYLELLDMGDGIMGYVSIPSINVSLPIRHGTSDEVLDSGAGHIRQTALPIGGVGNNPVITAHTGHKKAQLFNRLIEVKVGDSFSLHVLDEVLSYRVFKVEVIEPYYVERLVPQADRDTVTLLTCTPYGINSHRLLVHGVRIETDGGAEATPLPRVGFPFGIAALIGAALIVFVAVMRYAQRRQSRMGFGGFDGMAPSATNKMAPSATNANR